MARIMTRQQRLALGRARRALPQPVPIAITGWNTSDALTAMAPTDAVTLDNWYPDANGLTMRQGYTPYATGVGTGTVATLAEFNAGSTRKLIAAGSGKFYDASNAGAVGAALGSGFSSDWWQSALFNSHLFFCNGADAPQIFDGTTLSAASFTGPSNVANLFAVTGFMNRLFFLERNKAGFWYGPLLGISGALTFFDLSMLSELGGNAIAFTSFSYDGGSGVFDFFAVAMSSGEVFVYSGTDPSLSQNWQLVGRYRLSPPVNPRAVCRYGGEAYMTTFDDNLGMQQGLVALRAGMLPPRSKVSGAVKAAVAANRNANGWQALYYTQGRRIIFNVPNTDGTFDQHVYNVTNDAWCRFKGMPAATFGLFNDNLYFGGSAGGIVYQADTGNLDNGTQAINATGQQAWNLFGSGDRKAATVIRPIVQTQGAIPYTFGVGFDYGDINVPLMPTTAPSGSPWDTSPWDTSPWSPESGIDPHWHVAGGTGEALSWQLKVSATIPVAWLRTDVYLSRGAGL